MYPEEQKRPCLTQRSHCSIVRLHFVHVSDTLTAGHENQWRTYHESLAQAPHLRTTLFHINHHWAKNLISDSSILRLWNTICSDMSWEAHFTDMMG